MGDHSVKNMTLDDLAVMVAKGFEDVTGRLDKMDKRFEKVDKQFEKIDIKVQGLTTSVNNYLALSDKRYLELKAREKVIVSWVKTIADKTGVQINLDDLEKAV